MLEIMNQSNEIRATGRVRCLFKNARDVGLLRVSALDNEPDEYAANVFIVTSNAMLSNRTSQTARYNGNVKASQGDNYVKADEIELDRNTHVLKADGNVETHLVGVRSNGEIGANQVHTSSRHMTYSRNANSIEYLDDVVMTSEQLKLAASRIFVELDSEGQQPRKMIARGGVQIVRGPWFGKGEEGEYRIQENILVLSGRLAEVWDVNKRRSTGRRLTIYIPNDRLVVES
jgi:lipopolysaccharide export system protein LptA